MRIIDNKYDFYDYLQSYDDKLVFDRRGSFNLTKQIVCNSLTRCRYSYRDIREHMLVQCGATFWLILVTITEFDSSQQPINYSLELIDTWKNYDKPNKLLDVQLISFGYMVMLKGFKFENMKYAIDHYDLLYTESLSHHVKYVGDKEEKSTIPILAPSGLGNVINPVDMFCAIEEYYSIEKSKTETTEPQGITNDDKIVMHGFDTKISFRGKGKK